MKLKKIFGKGSGDGGVVSSYKVAAQHPDLSAEAIGLDRLCFIHHTTSIFNLGDYLSCPRHYFRYVPAPDAEPMAVIGGGVFGKYSALTRMVTEVDLSRRRRVAWGVGLSSKDGENLSGKVADFAANMDMMATRDPDNETGAVRFVPCSSVFNAITDIPPGDEHGIALNFDLRASGPDPLRMLAGFDGQAVFSNAMSENDFRRYFARTSHLITNSYHTAMWGLMSGRHVGIVGFSTKYSNVLSMFDLEGDFERYDKGDEAGLTAGITRIIRENRYFHLDDPAAYKRKLRDLNLGYARDLVSSGLFREIELVPDDERALRRRDEEVFRQNVLVRVST